MVLQYFLNRVANANVLSGGIWALLFYPCHNYVEDQGRIQGGGSWGVRTPPNFIKRGKNVHAKMCARLYIVNFVTHPLISLCNFNRHYNLRIGMNGRSCDHLSFDVAPFVYPVS